ncbi:SURF1 family protein [Kitasatospora sp. NPDC052896]|uniref:SURF1 family cytochrome oxidase biogenesis protein n=1 Tax=Kitasatospora sp. NPDC052896 TaxID=3364061 RepID=UPI0037CBBE3C
MVLRILLTRRWVVLTLVFFAIVPALIWLGQWQYHRYEQSNRQNAGIAAALASPPVAMEAVSRPGGSVPISQTYRTVMATGHYDVAHEFVVRQRTDASGDTIGYYVITPLVTTGGDVVLVNRGWVASGADATVYPQVPPAPAGQVTVTGRLRPDETSRSTGIRDRGGLPDRQYMLINSAQQAQRLSEPVVAGYLELTATSPTPPASEEAQHVPSPSNTDTSDDAVVGKGVHLPYAIQWWLFAALVPAGWVVLLRRDVREAREAAAAAAGAGVDGVGGTSGEEGAGAGGHARAAAP